MLIHVRRFSIISPKAFEEVVSKLMAQVGQVDVKQFHDALAASKTVTELERLVERTIGPSGLMQFGQFDAGEIVFKEEAHRRRILRLLIGNPLLMKKLVKEVPDAAAYARVTVLVDERSDGVHLSYDSRASLLAPLRKFCCPDGGKEPR